MATWNTGITGNDTAEDLYMEYMAAFHQFHVEEALKRIDHYVRTEMFDESDEEEWCNYIYSLADFMWKKGILTDSVKEKAIAMIDSGFGLGLWAEQGQKTLDSRKKKLAAFKEKLLSAQPPQLTWVCPLVRFACFHAVSAPGHLLSEHFSSAVSACSVFVCGKNCGQTAF